MPPFFEPRHPPVGIVALKSYLQHHGHSATCFDLNTDDGLIGWLRGWFAGTSIARTDGIGFAVFALLLDESDQAVEENVTSINGALEAKAGRPVDGTQVTAEEIRLALVSVRTLLDRFAAELVEEGYTVVGCSGFETTIHCALYLLRAVKRLSPGTRTLLGGPEASAEAEAVLSHFPFVDNVVAGHGEVPLRQLVERKFAGPRLLRSSRTDLSAEGLSTYPILDYADFDVAAYPSRTLGLTVQNGCQFACRFCSWRAHFGFRDSRDAQPAYDEMRALHDRHGTTLFHVCSAQVNTVALELARHVATSGPRLSWYGPANIDPRLFSAQNVPLLAEGGLTTPRFGVESGSDRLLRRMAKPHRTSDVEPVIGRLDDLGVETVLMLIVGFPGEDADDFSATLSLVRAIFDRTQHATVAFNTFELFAHPNPGLSWFEREHGPVVKIPKIAAPKLGSGYFHVLASQLDERATLEDRADELASVVREAGRSRNVAPSLWFPG